MDKKLKFDIAGYFNIILARANPLKLFGPQNTSLKLPLAIVLAYIPYNIALFKPCNSAYIS
jgi:hypothetical protein